MLPLVQALWLLEWNAGFKWFGAFACLKSSFPKAKEMVCDGTARTDSIATVRYQDQSFGRQKALQLDSKYSRHLTLSDSTWSRWNISKHMHNNIRHQNSPRRSLSPARLRYMMESVPVDESFVSFHTWDDRPKDGRIWPKPWAGTGSKEGNCQIPVQSFFLISLT